LPVPVTAKDISTASAFLNRSQPVVICDTPTVPSEPPEREYVTFDVNTLNDVLFAAEPHAEPVPDKFAL